MLLRVGLQFGKSVPFRHEVALGLFSLRNQVVRSLSIERAVINEAIKCPEVRVLFTKDAKPPLCRIASRASELREQRAREKAKAALQRSQTEKVMMLRSVIGPHDLEVKARRIIEFLNGNHPVRIVITTKKFTERVSPMSLEQTIMNLVTAVEAHVSSVVQIPQLNQLRKEYILKPKPKAPKSATPPTPNPAP